MPITNEQIKQEIVKRTEDFAVKGMHEPEHPRMGIGIALEITVRLLAPELFEQVLAVVQGRVS
jgi:hypothetical protein